MGCCRFWGGKRIDTELSQSPVVKFLSLEAKDMQRMLNIFFPVDRFLDREKVYFSLSLVTASLFSADQTSTSNVCLLARQLMCNDGRAAFYATGTISCVEYVQDVPVFLD